MDVVIRDLGITPYLETWEAMKAFTSARDDKTPDEIWLTEHPPVFTQGQAGKTEHVLDAHGIPIIATDRGGQVTYHGPGQLVAYVLFDLGRRGKGVRPLVRILEASVIDLLDAVGITARFRLDAPGVYVGQKKIASVGLRIRQGRSYHGLSFNVAMDLTPFQWINPCGYAGLEVTDLRELGIIRPMALLKQELTARIVERWSNELATPP
jgi:lipoyl(octanoyl) transferase